MVYSVEIVENEKKDQISAALWATIGQARIRFFLFFIFYFVRMCVCVRVRVRVKPYVYVFPDNALVANL